MTVHIIIHSRTSIASFLCDFGDFSLLTTAFSPDLPIKVENRSWSRHRGGRCTASRASCSQPPGMSAQFQSLDAKSWNTPYKTHEKLQLITLIGFKHLLAVRRIHSTLQLFDDQGMIRMMTMTMTTWWTHQPLIFKYRQNETFSISFTFIGLPFNTHCCHRNGS